MALKICCYTVTIKSISNAILSDLNLLDWSANNHVAVALGSSVYIWNASSGSIDQLFTLEDPEEYVSSVSWIKEGNILAAGTSNGNVEVTELNRIK